MENKNDNKIKVIPYPYTEFGTNIVGIQKMSITYIQPEDSNSYNSENPLDQTLTISTEDVPVSDQDIKEKNDGFYFNIETKKWSVNNADEIKDLVEDYIFKLKNSKENGKE